MASMKAKKGTPFERDVAYSLIQGGYEVNLLGDNTVGVDLIAKDVQYKYVGFTYIIECKNHKKFTWNELSKIYDKTDKTATKLSIEGMPVVVFHTNRQPVLVMGKGLSRYIVPFDGAFGTPFVKRPKGYKLSLNKYEVRK